MRTSIRLLVFCVLAMSWAATASAQSPPEKTPADFWKVLEEIRALLDEKSGALAKLKIIAESLSEDQNTALKSLGRIEKALATAQKDTLDELRKQTGLLEAAVAAQRNTLEQLRSENSEYRKAIRDLKASAMRTVEMYVKQSTCKQYGNTQESCLKTITEQKCKLIDGRPLDLANITVSSNPKGLDGPTYVVDGKLICLY